MAVGKLFQTLTFGGVNSGDYEVYITGAGVYDAPVRDVEMVTIPGRDGQYAVDQGRYEQIEVTYPAAVAKKSAKDFADTLREFRNAIASQVGYQRLEDTYNPDEYRMAVMSAGIQVKPNFRRTGEFDITFSCLPQRYLKAGEEDISLTESGTIHNPYPHTARPLYKMYGTGEVRIGDNFALANTASPIGDVSIASASYVINNTYTYDPTLFHAGDIITVGQVYGYVTATNPHATSIAWGAKTEQVTDPDTVTWADQVGQDISVFLVMPSVEITHGTPLHRAISITAELGITMSGGQVHVDPIAAALTVDYDGDSTIKTELIAEHTGTPFSLINADGSVGAVTGYSSVSSIGEPLYFDADTGEAYTISEGSTVVSRNSYARLGIQLPVLLPGDTAVDMDDTVIRLDVEPRWWII